MSEYTDWMEPPFLSQDLDAAYLTLNSHITSQMLYVYIQAFPPAPRKPDIADTFSKVS